MGEARGLNNARFEGEWEEVTLGEIGKTYGGLSGKTSADFGQGNARYISFLDVLEQVTVTWRRFDRVRVSSSESQNRVVSGDVLFNATSETPEDLAMGSMALVDCDELYLNSFCFGFRMADRGRCDSLFLAYFFRGIPGRAAMYGLAQGATRYNLSKQRFLRIQVPLPPLPEQRAIAAVLSDVDELIGSLEALIAKKRAIKQAAMQELLTGRTRLPGFGGEWEMRRLGDHLRFLRHGTNPRSDLTTDGTVEYLHYGDIHTFTHAHFDPRDRSMPTIAAGRAKRLDRLDDGDLVFVDASEDIEGVGKSVELKGLRDRQLVAGLHTIAVRFTKSVLADGFKAYLQFHPALLRHLRRLAAGTKVYATNRAHIASAEIPLPPLPEQQAIATILSDMDAEIAALEHRLDKTRAIKQGMMQQLLTGSIRLPIPDDDTEDDEAHDD